MKSLTKKISVSLALASAVFLGVNIAQALTLPVSPALFDTVLASPQQTTDTTATLVTSFNLVAGDYACFLFDGSLTTAEYECGTASTTPTILINLQRGLDFRFGTTTVSLNTFYHRSGGDVRITTFPVLSYFQQLLSGSTGFSNVIGYSNSISTTTINGNASNLVDVALLDSTAFTGIDTSRLVVNGIDSWNGSNFTATGTPTISLQNINANNINIASGTVSVSDLIVATSTSMTISMASSSSQTVRLGTATNTITLASSTPGSVVRIFTCNPPNSSAGTTTWAANPYFIHWSGGTVPAQTLTAGDCDLWTFAATSGTSTPFIFGGQIPW